MSAALSGRLAAAAAALLAGAGRQLVYSTLLFAVVALLARLARRRSPVLRHGLWSLVLLRLALPPGLDLPVSARRLVGGAVAGLAALLRAWLPGALAPAGGADAAASSPWAHSAAAGTAGVAPPWAPLAAALWLAGVLAAGALLAVRLGRYRRLLRAARPLTRGPLAAAVEDWRRAFGVRRPVRLVSSAAAVPPFTAGLFRPVIFLPAALAGERETAAECAIAHEMAHVARRDALWLGCQNLLQALWFFHPVAWAAGARLDEERERLCDRRVLAHGRLAPATYARGLVAVLRLNLEGGAPLPAFGDAKRRYEMRMRQILEHAAAAGSRPALSLAAVAAAALLLLPMAKASGEAAAAKAGSPAAPALSAPLPGARITSPFGPRHDPFGQAADAFHSGVDLAAAPGTPVLAPAGGVVEVATTRWSGGARYGTVVILEHDGGIATFYSHLGSLAVEAGQRVERGAPLGTTGATGEVTGPHLHFEVWRDGHPVDPATLVRGLGDGAAP